MGTQETSGGRKAMGHPTLQVHTEASQACVQGRGLPSLGIADPEGSPSSRTPGDSDCRLGPHRHALVNRAGVQGADNITAAAAHAGRRQGGVSGPPYGEEAEAQRSGKTALAVLPSGGRTRTRAQARQCLPATPGPSLTAVPPPQQDSREGGAPLPGRPGPDRSLSLDPTSECLQRELLVVSHQGLWETAALSHRQGAGGHAAMPPSPPAPAQLLPPAPPGTELLETTLPARSHCSPRPRRTAPLHPRLPGTRLTAQPPPPPSPEAPAPLGARWSVRASTNQLPGPSLQPRPPPALGSPAAELPQVSPAPPLSPRHTPAKALQGPSPEGHPSLLALAGCARQHPRRGPDPVPPTLACCAPNFTPALFSPSEALPDH
ncbi:WAS/WASL-interacting protein family member 1-like [Choloepus didactylus]|uniref:WAS/WASL-interacting protein family member 1-like n=1 Tax=Choloepus didactylus TaxID=27675 RepID=UPI00189D6E22|nr:WAS/WASL-interacting protein family member 1-like [Choloepus didactylus]